MKKFIITESERKRILNLHKSRSSNQYLMEQPEEEGMVDPEVYDFQADEYIKSKLPSWKEERWESDYANKDGFKPYGWTCWKPNPKAPDNPDESRYLIAWWAKERGEPHLLSLHVDNKPIYENLLFTKANADKILNYVKSN